MDTEGKDVIRKARLAFAPFPKPAPCTRHADLEDSGFNEMLLSTPREELSLHQIGTVAWGPVPSLTAEALAHFMPRLIELAVSGQNDPDGGPFFCLFVNWFHQGPDQSRFRLFGPEQREAMAEVFAFLLTRFAEQLGQEGWLAEAEQGLAAWAAAPRQE
ncbi:MAG: hypothetical protein AB1921_00280 [Thermodesulfobacteriota bacterium]